MGSYFCKQCRKKTHKSKQYDILLIGLKNSGKTQIGYWLMNLKNKYSQFPNTVGVQTFKTIIKNNAIITLIEIGGGDDIRPIWRHYYFKSMACIFVIDVSDISQIPIACKNLFDVMQNRYMIRKPFVIMLTKLKEDSMDIVDFNDTFNIEEIANRLQTPVLLSTIWNDDHSSLFESLIWIKKQIDSEYDNLMERMYLDKVINQKINKDILSLKEGAYKKLSNKRTSKAKLKHKKRFSKHNLTSMNLSFRKKKIGGNKRSASAPVPHHRLNENYNSDNLINRTDRLLNGKAESVIIEETSSTSIHRFKNKIKPWNPISIHTSSPLSSPPPRVTESESVIIDPLPISSTSTTENLKLNHDIPSNKIDFDTDQKLTIAENSKNKNFQVTVDVHYDATSTIEIVPPVVSTATTDRQHHVINRTFSNETVECFQAKLSEYQRSLIKSAPPLLYCNEKKKHSTMEILLKSKVSDHE